VGLRQRLAEMFGVGTRNGDGTSRRRVGEDMRLIRASRGRYRSILDREVTPDDLEQLRQFVQTRHGVEFYLEPKTAATTATAVAVAADGEWIRRRVGAPAIAHKLARELGIPVSDASVVGYPAAMRRYRRPL
jgi:hypothetical protein